MSEGVPRLQLDTLGGRGTPRGSASRQQALQRVFKGLDDDDDDYRIRPAAPSARGDTSVATSAVNESVRSTTFASAPTITPRASRDEIERRRKVMFDSEDEDTPAQPKPLSKVHASPTLGPTSRTMEREAPSRAKAPTPVPVQADSTEKEEVQDSKPPKSAPASAAPSYRAPSPRIGSWRQQSPGRSGRTPRAEIQRRQARQVKDDSDSDLDDIAARSARDAMPNTSPLSLAPAMNGAKRKTYSRHASPAPEAKAVQETKAAPVPSAGSDSVPTSSAAPSDDSTKALMEMVASLQKEIAGLREEIKEQPTVGQFEKLQLQLREQKAELASMRSNMEAMQRHMKEMPSADSSPQGGNLKTSSAVVSAEILPLHSMTTNNSGPDISFVNRQQTPTMQRSAAPPVPAAEPESSNRPVVESASLKTPATKVARVNKNVVVQRQPIPGAQVSQSDKVGIGISFGMTQKGDVFITGMAPNGPAKACGQIKRGDQLVAVDDTEIKGWDVKDIVGLIVGKQNTQVRLQVASLPDGHESSPNMMSPRS